MWNLIVHYILLFDGQVHQEFLSEKASGSSLRIASDTSTGKTQVAQQSPLIYEGKTSGILDHEHGQHATVSGVHSIHHRHI